MSASSASNEVLVIIGDSAWQEPYGRALFDVLNSSMPGMPQKEANFKILQIDPKNFTRSWFAWANTLFGEFLWKVYNEKPHLLK